MIHDPIGQRKPGRGVVELDESGDVGSPESTIGAAYTANTAPAASGHQGAEAPEPAPQANAVAGGGQEHDRARREPCGRVAEREQLTDHDDHRESEQRQERSRGLAHP